MTDPADLTIDEASSAIRSSALSPVELTESCLVRAELWEPVIRAFVRLEPEQAIQQARALTEEAARKGVRGPLHGIPLAIKDIIDVQGWPTTASSRVLSPRAAQADATIIRRLRASGAVFVGKTNTHEFAYGVVTPPTRNPWDAGRIPGGSSGGSAASIAVRGCLAALGTDTAGSVRIPAALCGVTGLKPSRGAVPMEGIIPLAPSMDVCGPLAGSARDVGLMWEAMTGRHAPRVWKLDGVAVGACEPLSKVVEAQGEVIGAVDAAIGALADAGGRKVPVDLPPVQEWDRSRATVLMSEAFEVHRHAGWYPDHADRYTAETRGYLERGSRISPDDVVEARRTLGRLSRRLLQALESVEVLALPTTPIVAPTVTEADRTSGPNPRRPTVGTLTSICGPVNWCGLASISVPCGFAQGDLPIGIQFVARDEEAALRAALVFQSVTSFHIPSPRFPVSESPQVERGGG